MLHETRRRAGPAFALLAALAFASLACAAAQSGVAAGKTLAKSAAPPVAAWLEDPLQILGVSRIAHLEQDVLVPLRDGTELTATLVVPDGASAGSRRPAILDQSPYVPQQELRMGRAVFSRLVRKGYVIVVVNDRGTQWSGGEYHWVKNATNDGVDAVAWITSQPWSSRAVGAWGCSSSGEVEFSLARASPPGLKAAVPMAAATGIGVIPGFADQGIFYTGGVPSFDWAWWYHGNGYWHHPKLPAGLPARERAALIQQFNPEAYAASSEDLTWAAHLPAEDVLSAIGSPETEFNELIRLAPGDPAWKEYDFLNDGDRTRVPMLLVDTWYDTIEAYGTTKAFQYLSSNSPNQYLIMGAGPHCTMGYETKQTMVGERPVGDARFDYAGTVVRWFDHWLVDDGRGKLDMPRVQYYPLASNHWESAGSWPPPSSPTKLYLYSQGHANSLSGDGQLLWHAGSGPADSFFDDPMRPVPTNGGGCCDRNVSRDQTAIERRQDVLVYTTPPLTQPLTIAGYLKATLYFSTSVSDTDLALKFVDVYPDGRAYNVLDTIERLRYRDGIEKPELMKPGRIYPVVLREMVVASRFAPGHRLRIEIAGTNFPEYERNLNTGGPSFNETRAVAAHDSIYHDRGHRSFFELPVVHDPR
jgi:uncharacterized protein